jgi:argonaute-like protein implicated in RNA metabolism and viral defense
MGRRDGLCAGGLLAALFTTVPVMGAGKLADSIPPFTPTNISTLLIDEQVIKELRITKDQTMAVKKIVAKSQERSRGDAEKIIKMPDAADKYPKIRALTALRADQLFQDLGSALSPSQVQRLKQIMLQQQGISIIKMPEIRAQLELSDNDVRRLIDLNDKLKKQIQEQALHNEMSRKDANDKLQAMSKGISDGVRAELNEQQQATLNELLGKPYPFRK